ncbi:nuclear transport factor 2 family protein [Pedobacter nutrimenti]|nr:nuclear transport factor 2 family protein [Pedobacter nutrimenti]
MKTINFNFSIMAFLLVICFLPVNAKCQESPQSVNSNELYNKIAHLDSALFDAFNNRKLETLKELFSEDLEFFHDQGGLTNYMQNIGSFEEAFKKDRKVRRELVAGSLEISPIKGYGAVETGIHRFYATEKGKKEQLSSEAKFAMIWREINGIWKMTRVISYAHHEYLK